MIEPYDEMKGDFILISNEVEAKYCLDKYGYKIADRHMPDKFRYLLIEYHQKQCESISNMFKEDTKEHNDFKKLSESLQAFNILNTIANGFVESVYKLRNKGEDK